MASDLYEILESYGARDIISVEEPSAVALAGMNAACLWTRSLAEVFWQEHWPDGVHSTLKVPKAVIRVSAGRGIEPGSVFDGDTASSAGVAASGVFGPVTVSWSLPLGVYAAAAYCHEAPYGEVVLATVSNLLPTSCSVSLEVLGSLSGGPQPFTLLLWWE